ncbi:Transposase [Phytophthora megakarya]|uniref:Transposase n=1 Tax=Phytophthora megakarya TaxID=4795 RepID=A0A225VIS6_9STRA|nr:Transposase [Phytophthora megakarya]
MARSHHHEVLYTPPYHPELRPIEMKWGALKNRIAISSAGTLGELGDMIDEGLAAIMKKERIGAYKNVLRQEQAYLREHEVAAPEVIPVPTREELDALALEASIEEMHGNFKSLYKYIVWKVT